MSTSASSTVNLLEELLLTWLKSATSRDTSPTLHAVEELEPHLQRLRDYVEACPIERPNNAGFMIRVVMDNVPVYSTVPHAPPDYSALGPRTAGG